MTPRERVGWLARTAGRALVWLLLGAVVGTATWGALRWAGGSPDTARWVAGVVGLVTAAGAGMAANLPKPTPPDEPPGPPPTS